MTTKRSTADTIQDMDKAAREAAEELEKARIDSDEQAKAVEFVAQWWRRHYLKAGHKRLARALLEYAPRK
jgi:hypothetical protein